MRPDTEQTYQERMLAVLVHIQRHLDRTPSLEELAKVAHFSPFHFHRIFKGMLGETVQEHQRRLRLERAAQRLKLSEQGILDIALEAGYETHESFTRAFKARFGEPPVAFRERTRTVRFPDAPSGVHYSASGRPRTFEPVKGEMMIPVRIETIGPLRVAFIRHIGPYPEVGATWQRLMQWAGPKGLFHPGVKCLGICYDDPEVTPPDKIRYDACLEVGPGVQGEGEVGVQVIEARDYAATYHRGPYENLAETYARVCGQWLPTSGREAAAAPCLEFYMNSPEHTPPADLMTEVCVPLKT